MIPIDTRATPGPVQEAPAADAPAPAGEGVAYAGAAPIMAGDPGFEAKFDRDGDGVGCQS
nr:excalibur calcium-binding domain-containing protein [Arthrobacter sp. 260]